MWKPSRTTAFSGGLTSDIEGAIKKLAARTNHYYTVRNVPLTQLLDMLVPPQDREDAVTVASKYDAFVAQHAFLAHLRLPRLNPRDDHIGPVGGEGLSLTYTIPRNVAGSFVVRAHDTHVRMAEGAEFVEKIETWIINACRWGFVKYMFNWVNNFVGRDNTKQARLLLPGILPLLRIADQHGVAAKLAPAAKNHTFRTVDPTMRAGLVIANQIIAEGLLYAEAQPETLPAHEALLSAITISAPVEFKLPHGDVGYAGRSVDVYPIMDI